MSQRFRGSEKAVHATQVAFDLEHQILKALQYEALEHDLHPSDLIREIVQLPPKTKAKRKRLSVSLSDEDYQALGERYGIDAERRLEIKERVMQELVEFAQHRMKE